MQDRTASGQRRIDALIAQLDKKDRDHAAAAARAEKRINAVRTDFSARVEAAKRGEVAAQAELAAVATSVAQQLADAERRVHQADARSHAVRGACDGVGVMYRGSYHRAGGHRVDD